MTKDNKDLVKGSLTVKRNIYYIILSWRENEKRKQKWISTGLIEKGNYREATRLLKEAIEIKEEELVSTTKDNNYNPLFTEYLKMHLEIIKDTIQPSTYSMDKNRVYNFIVPYFEEKNLRVKDVTRQHIMEFLKQRLDAGNKFKTAKKHIIIMSRCFNYAMSESENIIKSNPASNIKDPVKKSKKEKGYVGGYLSSKEVNNLIEHIKDNKAETPLMFAIYYGLRRSEIIGLKWEHIDFTNDVIHIEYKIVQVSGLGKGNNICQSPELKSNASYRTLPLVEPMKEYLLKHMDKVRKNKEYFGNAYNNQYSEFICVKSDGDIIKPNYVTKKFKDYMRELKITKSITLHGLRHTCATLLLELGYTLKDIQGWLGHSNYQITADIYAHVDVSSRIGMGKKIEELLQTTPH